MNYDRQRGPKKRTSRGGRAKGMGRHLSPEGMYGNSALMLNVAKTLLGREVLLTTITGTTYNGILKTWSSNFDCVLQLPHLVDKADSSVITNPDKISKTVVFKKDDIVTLEASNVQDDPTKDNFLIDSQFNKYNGQALAEKELEPWQDEDSYTDLGLGEETANGWDANEMFKKNEQKYGVTTTYTSDMEGYTVPLEKQNTQEWKEQEAKAKKIAAEIEKCSAAQSRLELENGNEDEESKFSAVHRPNTISSGVPGKYMTPQRRKIQTTTPVLSPSGSNSAPRIPNVNKSPRVTPPPNQSSTQNKYNHPSQSSHSSSPYYNVNNHSNNNSSNPLKGPPVSGGNSNYQQNSMKQSYNKHQTPPPQSSVQSDKHQTPPPQSSVQSDNKNINSTAVENKDIHRKQEHGGSYSRESSLPKDSYHDQHPGPHNRHDQHPGPHNRHDQHSASNNRHEQHSNPHSRHDQHSTPLSRNDQQSTPVNRNDQHSTPVNRNDQHSTPYNRQEQHSSSYNRHDQHAPPHNRHDQHAPPHNRHVPPHSQSYGNPPHNQSNPPNSKSIMSHNQPNILHNQSNIPNLQRNQHNKGNNPTSIQHRQQNPTSIQNVSPQPHNRIESASNQLRPQQKPLNSALQTQPNPPQAPIHTHQNIPHSQHTSKAPPHSQVSQVHNQHAPQTYSQHAAQGLPHNQHHVPPHSQQHVSQVTQRKPTVNSSNSQVASPQTQHLNSQQTQKAPPPHIVRSTNSSNASQIQNSTHMHHTLPQQSSHPTSAHSHNQPSHHTSAQHYQGNEPRKMSLKEEKMSELKAFSQNFNIVENVDKKAQSSPTVKHLPPPPVSTQHLPAAILSQPPPPLPPALSQPPPNHSSQPTHPVPQPIRHTLNQPPPVPSQSLPHPLSKPPPNVSQTISTNAPSTQAHVSHTVTIATRPDSASQIQQANARLSSQNQVSQTETPIQAIDEQKERKTSSFKLNPNVKEFSLNPNAKEFSPAFSANPTPTPPQPSTPQLQTIAAPLQHQVPTGIAPGFAPNMVQAYVVAPQHFQQRFKRTTTMAGQRQEISMQVAAATGTPILAPTPLTPISAAAQSIPVPMQQNVLHQQQPYPCQMMVRLPPPGGIPMVTTMVPSSMGPTAVYYPTPEGGPQTPNGSAPIYVTTQGVQMGTPQQHHMQHPGQPPTPQGGMHGNGNPVAAASGAVTVHTPGPNPPQHLIYNHAQLAHHASHPVQSAPPTAYSAVPNPHHQLVMIPPHMAQMIPQAHAGAQQQISMQGYTTTGSVQQPQSFHFMQGAGGASGPVHQFPVMPNP